MYFSRVIADDEAPVAGVGVFKNLISSKITVSPCFPIFAAVGSLKTASTSVDSKGDISYSL